MVTARDNSGCSRVPTYPQYISIPGWGETEKIQWHGILELVPSDKVVQLQGFWFGSGVQGLKGHGMLWPRCVPPQPKPESYPANHPKLNPKPQTP